MGTIFFSISGIIVDIIILSAIALSTYLGYRKGLVGVIFKLFVFIISLILVFILYKPVSNAIINNTQLDEKIASVIYNSLSNTSLANDEAISTSNTNLSEGVVSLINSLLSDAISHAKEGETLTYISTGLSNTVIRFLAIILIFVFSKLALILVGFVAEILASLPIIKTFNKSGGFLYGLIKGLLIVYVILAIFSLISPIISSWGIISSINKSFIGSRMYNHNVIIELISKH